MLHQAEEERQIALLHPLLIERQDERAAISHDQVIRVLDALGDAFAGMHRAQIVIGDEGAQRIIGNLGIDCHELSVSGAIIVLPRRARRAAEDAEK
jgi:hypothetical protein